MGNPNPKFLWVTLTLTPTANPGFVMWKVDPTKCFAGCEVNFFFQMIFLVCFTRFPLFPRLNETGHPGNISHRIQSGEESIFLTILLTLQAKFCRTLICPKILFGNPAQKFAKRRTFERNLRVKLVRILYSTYNSHRFARVSARNLHLRKMWVIWQKVRFC